MATSRARLNRLDHKLRRNHLHLAWCEKLQDGSDCQFIAFVDQLDAAGLLGRLRTLRPGFSAKAARSNCRTWLTSHAESRLEDNYLEATAEPLTYGTVVDFADLTLNDTAFGSELSLKALLSDVGQLLEINLRAKIFTTSDHEFDIAPSRSWCDSHMNVGWPHVELKFGVDPEQHWVSARPISSLPGRPCTGSNFVLLGRERDSAARKMEREVVKGVSHARSMARAETVALKRQRAQSKKVRHAADLLRQATELARSRRLMQTCLATWKRHFRSKTNAAVVSSTNGHAVRTIQQLGVALAGWRKWCSAAAAIRSDQSKQLSLTEQVLVFVESLRASTSQMLLLRHVTAAFLYASLSRSFSVPDDAFFVLLNGKPLCSLAAFVRLSRDDRLSMKSRAPLLGGMQAGDSSRSSPAMAGGGEGARDAKKAKIAPVAAPQPVQTPAPKSLEELIDVQYGQMREPEKMEGADKYMCERCNTLVDATKNVDLTKMPAVLVSQVLRYDATGSKDLSTRVPFDEQLKVYDNSKQDFRFYWCTAVVVHRGRQSIEGHYYCFGKLGSAWYKFDDTHVGICESVQQQFRGVAAGWDTAYLLFYCDAAHVLPAQPIGLVAQPVGLKNPHNICYANAVLQALYVVNAVSPRLTQSAVNQPQHLVHDQLQALFTELDRRSDSANAEPLLEALSSSLNDEKWRSPQQQDAPEFFERLVEVLEKEGADVGAFKLELTASTDCSVCQIPGAPRVDQDFLLRVHTSLHPPLQVVPFPATTRRSGGSPIPCIVHKIFLNKAEPSKQINDALETWRKNAPEYSIWLWNEEAALSFLPADGKALFLKLKPLAYKADLLRLFILDAFGGVYSDVKQELRLPLHELLGDHRLVYVMDQPLEGHDLQPIQNCFMAAAPEHPFIKECIDLVCDNVKYEDFGEFRTSTTGPDAVAQAFKTARSRYPEPEALVLHFYKMKSVHVVGKVRRSWQDIIIQHKSAEDESWTDRNGNDYVEMWRRDDVFIIETSTADLVLSGFVKGAGSWTERTALREYRFGKITASEGGESPGGRPIFRAIQHRGRPAALWYSDGRWVCSSRAKFRERQCDVNDEDGIQWPPGTLLSEETDSMHPSQAVLKWFYYDGRTWSRTTLAASPDQSVFNRPPPKLKRRKAQDLDPPWLIQLALQFSSSPNPDLEAEVRDLMSDELNGSAWSLLDVQAGYWTPLTWLCRCNKYDEAKLLLDGVYIDGDRHKASLEQKDPEARTPLICASEYNSERCLELLIERGADADVTWGGRDLGNVSTDKACQERLRNARSNWYVDAAVERPLRSEEKVHEAQEKIGQKLADVIAGSYGSSFAQRFNKVEFLIVTHRAISLRNQTRKRLVELRPAEAPNGILEETDEDLKRVITYVQTKELDRAGKPTSPENDLVASLVANAAKHRRTLYLLIADECHFGAGHDDKQTKIINRPGLWDSKHDNIVVLLCSATPYVVLTSDSAVPERYEHKSTGQVVWVDGVHSKAWAETDGTPDFSNDLPAHQIFDGPKVLPEWGNELNVVVWSDVNPNRGMYCGLDHILHSVTSKGDDILHPVLEVNRRWKVDEDYFEKVVAAAAAAAATAAAGSAAAKRLDHAELLAVDYGFSLLYRWFRATYKKAGFPGYEQIVLTLKEFNDCCSVATSDKSGKRYNYDFATALKIILDFEQHQSPEGLEAWAQVLEEQQAVKQLGMDLQGLLKALICATTRGRQSLTDKVVDALFSSEGAPPVMQVIRLPTADSSSEGKWGLVVTKYILQVRSLLWSGEVVGDYGKRVPFEVVRDLSNASDGDLWQKLRPGFFLKLQRALNEFSPGSPDDLLSVHACQHRTPKSGPCPCQRRGLVPASKQEPFREHAFQRSRQLQKDIEQDRETLTKKEGTEKCAEPWCYHMHTRVECFADLVPSHAKKENRKFCSNVLLILVDKGRLGDTFPDTFQCMDMRARPNIKQLETMVQEIGRLCRYGDDGILPYALVCDDLGKHLEKAKSLKQLMEKKASVGEVDELISRKPQADKWMESGSFITYLRRNFSAGGEARLKRVASQSSALPPVQARSSSSQSGARQGSAPPAVRAQSSTKVKGSYDVGRSQSRRNLHFDERPADVLGVVQQPRWHQRRLVLFGEPQIGKTAAFVSCIAKLKKRVAEAPELPLTGDDNDDDVDSDDAGGMDEFDKLKGIAFMHTKSSPANGDYGDPACDAVWAHYQQGRRADQLGPDLLKSDLDGGKGGRGVPPPKARASASSVQLPTSVKKHKVLPNLPCSSNVSGPPATQRRRRVDVHFGAGRVGKLHIPEDVDGACWETIDKGRPKLRIPTSGYCQLPIFMPSVRSTSALLDLARWQFPPGQKYLQVICIYPESIKDYKALQAIHDVTLFEYPFDADLGDENCVGYSRHWVHCLACQVCQAHEKGGNFYVMHDDNVRNWLEVDLKEGTFKEPPNLSTVLSYFETGFGWLSEEGQPGMRDVALYGFHMYGGKKREGKKNLQSREPFHRKHCMKVVIMNVDRLRAFSFNPRMHAMEDIDFNLRVSGKLRVPGGGSKYLQREGEQLVLRPELQAEDQGFSVSGPTTREEACLVCKVQRFQFERAPPDDKGAAKATQLERERWVEIQDLDEDDYTAFFGGLQIQLRAKHISVAQHASWRKSIPESKLDEILRVGRAPDGMATGQDSSGAAPSPAAPPSNAGPSKTPSTRSSATSPDAMIVDHGETSGAAPSRTAQPRVAARKDPQSAENRRLKEANAALHEEHERRMQDEKRRADAANDSLSKQLRDSYASNQALRERLAAAEAQIQPWQQQHQHQQRQQQQSYQQHQGYPMQGIGQQQPPMPPLPGGQSIHGLQMQPGAQLQGLPPPPPPPAYPEVKRPRPDNARIRKRAVMEYLDGPSSPLKQWYVRNKEGQNKERCKGQYKAAAEEITERYIAVSDDGSEIDDTVIDRIAREVMGAHSMR